MTITAQKVKDRFNTQPVIVYRDLAGAGKSKMVGEFADLIKDDNERVAFGTNTRKGRDDFVGYNPDFVIIKGITEIIEEHADKNAAKVYCSYFDTHPDEKDKLFKLQNAGYIGTVQYNDIKREQERYNQLLNNSQFVALTVAKIQIGDFVKNLYGRYVFLDEMRQDKIWTAEECYKVYLKDRSSEENSQVNKFTKNILKATHSRLTISSDGVHYDIEPQKIKGVCFLSAEKSLQEIFKSKTMPAFKAGNYDLSVNEILADNDLSIVYVRSTSNNKTHSKRNDIAGAIRKAGYKIISDGLFNNIKIGDFNIEECKGKNTMKDMNLCSIIAHPTANEIVDTMAALGVESMDTSDQLKQADEFIYDMNMRDLQVHIDHAVSIIISDKANQSIGRNTGHRNIKKGYKHVLVVPYKLKDLLNLDVTTDNEYLVTKRDDVGLIEDVNIKSAFGELFNGKEHLINDEVNHWLSSFNTHQEAARELKGVKNTIKDRFIRAGVSERQVTKDKLVIGVINALKARGVVQRECKRKQVLHLATAVITCIFTDSKEIIDL